MSPQQQQIWALKQEGLSRAEIASRLGISEKSVKRALEKCFIHNRVAEQAGPGVMDALERTGVDASHARFGYRRIKDQDGSFNTVFWKLPPAAEQELVGAIRDALEGLPALPPVAAPSHSDSDLLTLYPIADAHIGMLAWARETGEAYDTEKAARRVVEWVGAAVDAAPASGTAVILDVGDLTHADDQTNQTPRSKHGLDVDTRHFRTVEMTIACLAAAIEYAARKHKIVKVKCIPGNHNPTAYLAVLFALRERYRDNPRIEVEAEPGDFWVHEFGRVMLAAHHGDKAKPDRLAHFMADTYAEVWGRTKYRHLFTGHLHHHRSAEIGGIVWEQLPALAPRDAYAVSHAYSARAALQSITYHSRRGEVQRFKVSA